MSFTCIKSFIYVIYGDSCNPCTPPETSPKKSQKSVDFPISQNPAKINLSNTLNFPSDFSIFHLQTEPSKLWRNNCFSHPIKMCWKKVRVQQIIGVRIIKIGFFFWWGASGNCELKVWFERKFLYPNFWAIPVKALRGIVE